MANSFPYIFARPTRSKDDVRLVVGLSSEIWLEVADQGIGMVDSEVSTSPSLMRYFGADIDVIAHSLTSSGVSSSWAFEEAVATTRTPHPGTDSSRTNSANTDHASDKPLMLVALSATEAVGWEDLEAKVS